MGRGGLWDPFCRSGLGVYRVRLLANAQAESGLTVNPYALAFTLFDPTEEQLKKRYRVEKATLVAEVEIPASEPRLDRMRRSGGKRGDVSSLLRNRLLPGQYPMGDLNRREINAVLKEIKERPEFTVELRGMEVEGRWTCSRG